MITEFNKKISAKSQNEVKLEINGKLNSNKKFRRNPHQQILLGLEYIGSGKHNRGNELLR